LKSTWNGKLLQTKGQKCYKQETVTEHGVTEQWSYTDSDPDFFAPSLVWLRITSHYCNKHGGCSGFIKEAHRA
jgi:hypothetical protein